MPIVVDQLSLPPMGTNCFIVQRERGAAECVVVDPGAAATEIRLQLARLGTRPAAILVTHCHWDHIGAVADLAEATGAPVYMEATESQVMENPRAFYPDVPVRPYAPDVRLEGDETFEVADIEWETLRVPGHSPGHVAYHSDGCLFSGDVLFAGSVGRTDIPFGDWDVLLQSIRTLVERFPPDTRVYPGHGFPTTLGRELDRNPFLGELRAAAREEAP